jgi:hypothetical protein
MRTRAPRWGVDSPQRAVCLSVANLTSGSGRSRHEPADKTGWIGRKWAHCFEALLQRRTRSMQPVGGYLLKPLRSILPSRNA